MKKRIYISLDEDTIAMLELLSESNKRTKSNEIAKLIAEAYKKAKGNKS